MANKSGTSSRFSFLKRIISGGQTGADRAALDVALALKIPHGGWVPRDRRAEDGPLPSRYRVRETPSPLPAVRTEWNIRDSDATVIFSHGRLTGGSALTAAMARKYRKPCLHVNFAKRTSEEAIHALQEWLHDVQPAVLNVAGPRASSNPEIYEVVHAVLLRLFTAEDRPEAT